MTTHNLLENPSENQSSSHHPEQLESQAETQPESQSESYPELPSEMQTQVEPQLNPEMEQDEKTRPPYSLSYLMAQAILDHEDTKATLSQITEWIMKKYPYYRHKNNSWHVTCLFTFFLLLISVTFQPCSPSNKQTNKQINNDLSKNALRNNLSNKGCFHKLPKAEGSVSRGAYWTIDAKMINILKTHSYQKGKKVVVKKATALDNEAPDQGSMFQEKILEESTEELMDQEKQEETAGEQLICLQQGFPRYKVISTREGDDGEDKEGNDTTEEKSFSKEKEEEAPQAEEEIQFSFRTRNDFGTEGLGHEEYPNSLLLSGPGFSLDFREQDSSKEQRGQHIPSDQQHHNHPEEGS